MKISTSAVYWIALSCVFLGQHPLSLAQENSATKELIAKLDFIEVWDVEGRSREDFLTQITQCPSGICEQSLVAMGHRDGNKIPLASGKMLITTRSAPDYTKSPTYQRLSRAAFKYDRAKWAALTEYDLRSAEAQLLPNFVEALSNNDEAQFDKIFRQQADEFAAYRLKLDANKVREAFKVYQTSTTALSKEEVLSVLYLSDDDSLLRAASFIVADYLKTPDDLVDVLPLLLYKRVGVQAAIEAYVRNMDGKIDWQKHAEFLPHLLNNPNPYRTMLVLKILDKSGITRETIQQCLQEPIASFQEIQSSKVLIDEKRTLNEFLNRYTQ
jgi:hypothetical protein